MLGLSNAFMVNKKMAEGGLFISEGGHIVYCLRQVLGYRGLALIKR